MSATGIITNANPDVPDYPVIARLRPVAGFKVDDQSEAPTEIRWTADSGGGWSQALEKNGNISPAYTYWEIEERLPRVHGGTKIWAIVVVGNASLASSGIITVPEQLEKTAITLETADARYIRGVGTLGSTSLTFAEDILFKSGIPWVDVRGYGAAGNGTGNDAVFINLATATAPAGSLIKGTPGDNYRLTSAISASKSLIFDFTSCTVTQVTSHTPAIQCLTTVDIFKVIGGTYVGPQYLTNRDDERAINIAGTSAASPTTRVEISGCKFLTWGGYGPYLKWVKDFHVGKNTVRDISYAGVSIDSGSTGTILQNFIKNVGEGGGSALNAYGITLSRVGGGASLVTNPLCADIVVGYNHVEDIPLWEAYDGHGVLRCSFIGNSALNVKHGVVVTTSDGLYGPKDCSIIGNTLDSGVTNGTAQAGIIVSGVGTTTQKATCTVVGNTVSNFGDQTSNSDAAIIIRSSESVTVHGNNIINPSPTGILLAEDALNTSITGNSITDPWSNSVTNPTGVWLRVSGSTAICSGNTVRKDTKAATFTLLYGFRTSSDTTNGLVLGQNRFSSSTAGAQYVLDGAPAPGTISGPLKRVEFTLNPANIVDGDVFTSANIDVSSGGTCFVGDAVQVFPPTTVIVDKVMIYGFVHDSGDVRITIFQKTGGALDLPSDATWGVLVTKRGNQ